ncbi:MAG TPA: FlgD immunoglobulin-like domain containing protein, partial [candidate division Zixibacteria bacterium]|nr:FlgD immunoglobulin-like domain containing protein [candidate division Zixibacteria bacterium]
SARARTRPAAAVPVVGVSEPEPPLPAGYALAQNYPNPFNPATTIAFRLAEAGDVAVAVYNAAGQLVRLLRCGRLGPGNHAVMWDGRAEDGAPAASGCYLYRLEGDVVSPARKMLLVK